ncbi:MAG TPA: indole-3-glycerol-phosphate synthase [Methanosarcinales archaeon]|nr:indole-3-glycerol-phosphate synthase [Methanosarcinales archaeon]
MHKVINEIIQSTKKRVENLRVQERYFNKRDFIKLVQYKKSKGKIPIIAEVKPASPTKVFGSVTPSDAANIACKMQKGGAVAISVLTEPNFFKGSLENLLEVRKSVDIPVLRKDFIIDEKQIYEVETDLILLIAGILINRFNKLDYFVDIAIAHGVEPLVEVHNEEELEIALSTNTRVIGINNRNLNTLEVDLNTTERLIQKKEIKNKIIISESGVNSARDARRMINSGADAILVGSAIMQGDILEKTRELCKG